MSKSIEFQIENSENGRWYLVVRAKSRLEPDEVNEVIREYEIARIRRASELLNCRK